MYDEDEIEGLMVGHSVEDEHGLHREMPRTGTVGRGDDYSDTAHDERHESARQPQVGGEVETEEGEVVMNEVAKPDANGEEEEQGDVLHVLQRGHALPDAMQGGLHFIVNGQAAQQEMQEQQGGDATDGRHEPTRGRKLQQCVDACARLVEKGAEDAHLEQNGARRDAGDQQGVNGALGDNGAEGFGKRGAIVAFQYAAAHELPDAWHHQAGCV